MSISKLYYCANILLDPTISYNTPYFILLCDYSPNQISIRVEWEGAVVEVALQRLAVKEVASHKVGIDGCVISPGMC